MNRARAARRHAFVSPSTVGRLALLAVSAVVITGCTAGPDGGPAVTPTAGPTASGDCSDVDAGATKNPLVVTPEQLCEADGSAWAVSAFILIISTPRWDAPTPECDEARKTAFYDAWEPASAAIQTLELLESPESDNTVGSVGISVIDSPDAAAAVSALDAEGAACGLGTSSQQLGLEHGAWKGVRGQTSRGADDERWSWWTAVDGRWALVQAYAVNDASDAEVADLESAVTTLLDAQESVLTR